MPGRGLEPLWISPPDPKSGASADFATLARFSAIDLAQILAQAAPSQQASNGESDVPRQTYTCVPLIRAFAIQPRIGKCLLDK